MIQHCMGHGVEKHELFNDKRLMTYYQEKFMKTDRPNYLWTT